MAFKRGDHQESYPFLSNYHETKGIKLHYLDEGPKDAPPMVMLHGNPTWSFYYRDLVKEFRKDHRVIVPDHIGMGLSDKPDDSRYSYRLEQRIHDVGLLLDSLGVTRDVTLVMHDWGGMIGMGWATRFRERVKRLVLFNTGAFNLPPGKSFPFTLGIVRNTPLGPFLVRGLNIFARAASYWCATSRPLTPALREAYCSPYDSWDNRIATLRFVEDIPLEPAHPSYQAVKMVEDNLTANFGKTPALICWGAKDFVFDDPFLEQWKRYLPQAEAHRFADAGHYVLEDALERIVPLMRTFLQKHP